MADEKKVTVKWACPDCGADANKHGKGGKEKCHDTLGGRSKESCNGFICECDPREVPGADKDDHGLTFDNTCPSANCFHCRWSGEFPQMPKKLQSWEKQALKAGWAPPEKRKKELGL